MFTEGTRGGQIIIRLTFFIIAVIVILQRLSALKCPFLRRPTPSTLHLITRTPFGLHGAPGCF